MKTFFLIVHTIISVALIYMVQVQMSKFSELGGAFGSGGLHTVFGRRKGLDTGGKITLVLSVLFFVSCVVTAFVLTR
ncbi:MULTISPECIES: preprotein translocase subunit SecG [Thermotoga]|jgi:preprotein translocase subunit SecG|uniref:Preprotein translocase, SecG subunit n=4 Tax=Thermotoga TaxID=2335 RepID=A0ACD6B8F7_THESQ|nr:MULTISPECIES: preprotein translocase subunit SecG [Thermotoga]3DIN_E Chain E, Preprotein translocase subunit SecG [Thermotoga sp. RQ2]3DIN_H Chain H, Preprotein translocase subunit SecG [Thermotoga sp. RQ2]KUK23213.1 MAG: Protein translocase subunit secG [Thermotoga petrophila]KUK33220.1 MAG: Protein translocase subunit secG [Thermotoga sp. 47_83]MBZ4661479.1 preprotein translocase subunit SecG [Thermotoga sp.]ABQ46465.1 protein translocase subunit secG [Thermotoga petrophila RKU-1]ACB088